jgi:hypothetical protein
MGFRFVATARFELHCLHNIATFAVFGAFITTSDGGR